MKLIRRFLTVALVLTLIAAGWLWWSRPQKIDMANYAPADALAYLESNRPVDIAASIVNTDAWKALGPLLQPTGGEWPGWLRLWTVWTGLGPTQIVIFARAQMAIVVLDLGLTNQNETLIVKPEAAIIIETHTSEQRTKPTVEQALSQFAEKAYPQHTFQKSYIGGTEFLVWTASTGARQIVAAIEGSMVVVGNSERAVRTCLDVRAGQRPSLRDDPELQQMRHHLAADRALAFGFVSSSNAARLLSLSGPLLFGTSPGGLQLDSLIAGSAPKLLRGVGWSSHEYRGGIEDRFLFSLQPTLVARLRPLFQATSERTQALKILPDNVHSLTLYRFHDPAGTWKVFESAVSAHLDTLSSVVFASLLKSALSPYGIDEAELFLSLVGPELMTVRLKQDAQRALLVAYVRDETRLRELLIKPMKQGFRSDWPRKDEVMEVPGTQSALSLSSGYLLAGSSEDVRRCIQTTARITPTTMEKLEHFVPLTGSANIVTYTNDADRVRNFIEAISRAKGSSLKRGGTLDLNLMIDEIPYCATETTLGDNGLERKTRSSFGQFSTLLPLLFPDS